MYLPYTDVFAPESSRHRPTDEIEHEQVEGIEYVEQILAELPTDEAAPSVVEVDRDEGQTRYPSHAQIGASYGSLKDAVPPQYIQLQNEPDTEVTVVSPKDDVKYDQPEKPQGEPLRRDVSLLPLPNQTECQKAKKQRKQHVL